MTKKTKIEGFSAVQADTGKKIELAMQDLRLEGTITEAGATLKVQHLFKSAEKEVIEAVYAFMLPRDAALHRFKIVAENFNVSSKLLKTKDAKKVYEDGINDFFIVKSNGVTVYSIQIFSRSGVLVYKAEAPTLIWDGRNLSGQEMHPGTYYYVIRPASGSGRFEKTGFVLLYR